MLPRQLPTNWNKLQVKDRIFQVQKTLGTTKAVEEFGGQWSPSEVLDSKVRQNATSRTVSHSAHKPDSGQKYKVHHKKPKLHKILQLVFLFLSVQK